jgi:hypothetical protein
MLVICNVLQYNLKTIETHVLHYGTDWDLNAAMLKG